MAEEFTTRPHCTLPSSTNFSQEIVLGSNPSWVAFREHVGNGYGTQLG